MFGLIVKWRKSQAASGLNFLSKLQDTARYAAFLATYSGAFVAVDEGIAALFGKRRYAQARIESEKFTATHTGTFKRCPGCSYLSVMQDSCLASICSRGSSRSLFDAYWVKYAETDAFWSSSSFVTILPT